jgi:hypothetical protein
MVVPHRRSSKNTSSNPAKQRPRPNVPRGLLEAACSHRAAGRLAAAEGLCQKILSATPGDPGALLLAVLAQQQGKEEEAIGLFRQVIIADADCAAADIQLGRVFEARGDLTQQ